MTRAEDTEYNPDNVAPTKKAVLSLILLTLTATITLAATEGFDRADDPAYADGWTNGDDGGTIDSFGAWDLTDNNSGPGVCDGQ
ncbi:MAG TPA: hypothetical protein VK993_10355 [Chthoniobacterales bacterium]|nr:hypothetical protein [Chthoniobacterales bacterium]